MKKFSLILILFLASFLLIFNVSAEDNSSPDVSGGTGTQIYDNFDDEIVSCGNNLIEEMPSALPKVISIIYSVVQVLVPIILVIFGTLDLVKGVISQKEEEIKKGQQIFIKRLISAVIVFFVFVIVKFLISLVADNSGNDIMDCVECFVENDCD